MGIFKINFMGYRNGLAVRALTAVAKDKSLFQAPMSLFFISGLIKWHKATNNTECRSRLRMYLTL